MRQVIDEATWKAVEGAICVGGLGYSEAGRKFGIEPHAIMGKAKRNNWPLPSKIAERAAVLQARYNRNGNEEVIQAAAETWAEKGEAHRQLACALSQVRNSEGLSCETIVETELSRLEAEYADARSERSASGPGYTPPDAKLTAPLKARKSPRHLRLAGSPPWSRFASVASAGAGLDQNTSSAFISADRRWAFCARSLWLSSIEGASYLLEAPVTCSCARKVSGGDYFSGGSSSCVLCESSEITVASARRAEAGEQR
jgi:hypothetical protein